MIRFGVDLSRLATRAARTRPTDPGPVSRHRSNRKPRGARRDEIQRRERQRAVSRREQRAAAQLQAAFDGFRCHPPARHDQPRMPGSKGHVVDLNVGFVAGSENVGSVDERYVYAGLHAGQNLQDYRICIIRGHPQPYGWQYLII